MESDESSIRIYVPTYLTRGPTLGHCSWAKLTTSDRAILANPPSTESMPELQKASGEKVEEPLA